MVLLQSHIAELTSENICLDKKLSDALSDKQMLQNNCDTLQGDLKEKEDKIVALRSVARALESENELLLREREAYQKEMARFRGLSKKDALREALARISELNVELRAKDEERAGFLQRFERLESEKLNIMRQCVTIEKDLDQRTHEKDELQLKLLNHVELLDALRESKRTVEAKLQKVMESEKSALGQAEEAKNNAVLLEAKCDQLQQNPD